MIAATTVPAATARGVNSRTPGGFRPSSCSAMGGKLSWAHGPGREGNLLSVVRKAGDGGDRAVGDEAHVSLSELQEHRHGDDGVRAALLVFAAACGGAAAREPVTVAVPVAETAAAPVTVAAALAAKFDDLGFCVDEINRYR